VGYSSAKILCATTKESGAAVKEGMLACARCKSYVILSSSTMYMLTITYPCFIPVMSQKCALFGDQCPFGVAAEWSHRDGPLSMGASLDDHYVPMNDVQSVIFSYRCIVDLI
jgi:hypothetical protein